MGGVVEAEPVRPRPVGPPDRCAQADVNVLAVRFPAATWQRILTELEASGLIADFTAACVDHRPTPSLLEQCLPVPQLR